MTFSVREIQPTPNPNAAKFILDKSVAERPISFFSRDAAKDHPLACRLFDIPGVCSVLMLGDFITVNKLSEARWDPIRKKVKKVLAGE